MLGASQTPTPREQAPLYSQPSQQQLPSSQQTPQQVSSSVEKQLGATPLQSRPSFDRDGFSGSNLQAPSGAANGPRSLGSSAVSFAPRGYSFNPTIGPGSFSSELRSQMNASRAGSRAELYNNEKIEEEEATAAEQTLTALKEQLNREMKIKEGSENMLEALNNKKAKQTKEQRARVEAELNTSNSKIRELRTRIADTQWARAAPATPTRNNRTTDTSAKNNELRSPPSATRSRADSDLEDPVEQSPTFALAELLQALEVEGLGPEYYVTRANVLVDLLSRHPTLKYDLVWPVFGLRMQVMLCSDAREVVAAGYRVVRHAISDVSSLKKIRELNTDFLVMT